MGQTRHNCGLCVTHTLHNAYSFMSSLQHRGREVAGIAAIGNDRIDVLRWEGEVRKFGIEDLHDILPGSNYHTFFGHVRYATRGRKDRLLDEGHPQVIGGKRIDLGSHVLFLDCDIVGVHNGQTDAKYYRGGVDESKLKTGVDTEALLHYYVEKREREFLRKIPGAYTLAIASKRESEVVVIRDRTGIKPGVLGFKDGKYVVTSEDIAIRKSGGTFVEDLTPGAIYYLNPNGSYIKEQIVKPDLRYCFFEYNYIAHVDSILNGVSVRRLREVLGEKMAEEFKLDLDLITYLPRCPEMAARSFERKTGIPFQKVFYKMRGERSFQGPDAQERRRSIRANLNLLPAAKKLIKGKIVGEMEDSTVRGNVSKWSRHLLYDVGKVKEGHLLNYTPKIGIVRNDGVECGCDCGVDMPPEDNFIARGRTDEEISAEIGMPVHYLSLEGMLEGYEKAGIDRKELCYHCIGGEHPFKKISI